MNSCIFRLYLEGECGWGLMEQWYNGFGGAEAKNENRAHIYCATNRTLLQTRSILNHALAVKNDYSSVTLFSFFHKQCFFL